MVVIFVIIITTSNLCTGMCLLDLNCGVENLVFISQYQSSLFKCNIRLIRANMACH